MPGKMRTISQLLKSLLAENGRLNSILNVENQYFDRVEEPGEFEVALLNIKQNGELHWV
jgi:hypothetical protein